eukprot:scaffold4567_cov92-Isochrysis_galbana.AAC.3
MGRQRLEVLDFRLHRLERARTDAIRRPCRFLNGKDRLVDELGAVDVVRAEHVASDAHLAEGGHDFVRVGPVEPHGGEAERRVAAEDGEELFQANVRRPVAMARLEGLLEGLLGLVVVAVEFRVVLIKRLKKSGGGGLLRENADAERRARTFSCREHLVPVARREVIEHQDHGALDGLAASLHLGVAPLGDPLVQCLEVLDERHLGLDALLRARDQARVGLHVHDVDLVVELPRTRRGGDDHVVREGLALGDELHPVVVPREVPAHVHGERLLVLGV